MAPHEARTRESIAAEEVARRSTARPERGFHVSMSGIYILDTVNPVPLDPLVERASRDSQSLRRAADVPALLPEHPARSGAARLRAASSSPGRAGCGVSTASNPRASASRTSASVQERRALEDVAQLADVAGPGMRLQAAHRGRRQDGRAPSELGRRCAPESAPPGRGGPRGASRRAGSCSGIVLIR